MKINIGLFFGGKSVEHEVSVITASQTAAAMDDEKYEIIPVYISKDNEMYTGPDLLTPAAYRDLPSLLGRSRRVTLIRDRGKVHLVRYPAGMLGKPIVADLDLAFPVTHGTNGEDGSLQGFFQMLSLPYVGSDVGASASGMDKRVAKLILENAGLPVLPGYYFRSAEYQADPDKALAAVEAFHSYPLMVKPNNLGSSVGISPAHDREGLRDSIELAASFAEGLLVEPMLTDMREINCAVMGDGEHTEASACEEPLSTGEILSYRDKYQGGGEPVGKAAGIKGGAQGGGKGMSGSLRRLPAELDEDKEEEIKALAQKAFLALGCGGVVRVDFLLNNEDDKVYVNELNTIPGSLAFYLWEAQGKSFRQMTEELVQLALRRDRMRERLIWSNDVNILAGMPRGAKGAGG
ncbi:MAG: D-alanine--D-alanine ligase [Clostridiales bacterium]|nr:D-alanine--D-alanine ligase [Clostridiales bacterium]